MSEIKFHRFDIEDAKKYGVPAATFLANIRYWVAKNKEAGSNLQDGRHWTYNSRESFRELFPYWTAEQIKSIVIRMKKAGILLTGNFNKKRYDKTTWYTINDESSLASGEATSSSSCDHPIDRVKSQDAGGESNRPIPDINLDQNPIYPFLSKPARRCAGQDAEDRIFRNGEKDWWYYHFLKSSFYENGFLGLTPEMQRDLRERYPEPDDKDDFLGEMQIHLKIAPKRL